MSIRQSEVELNHSSEQCCELFFKTLGLLFLNGPGAENVQLLTVGLENCRQCGLISEEEYEALSEQLDLQALGRDYGSLFCLGGSSLSLYESVWLTGLAMQEPRDELRKILRRDAAGKTEGCRRRFKRVGGYESAEGDGFALEVDATPRRSYLG